MRILEGDILAELRKLPASGFAACFCDPPYGMGESRPANSATPRKSSRERIRSGFMGMKWDAQIPGVDTWAAILRVLKPGAPLLAFGGARTHHRLMCAIEDAGFAIADTLCWLHGQGFPKGHAQLKPAWEPIILAWKKGKRALNIEGSRIAASARPLIVSDRRNGNQVYGEGLCGSRQPGKTDAGRWPANVILDEETGALLDAQTGILVSGNHPAKRSSDKHRNVYAGWKSEQCLVHRGTDAGGASRFFYCAKASKSERGEGNNHPTVKPLKLIEYLARLILPPEGGRLLVPFSGSGSEMLGSRNAGWKDITGIEQCPEYNVIARKRLHLRTKAA